MGEGVCVSVRVSIRRRRGSFERIHETPTGLLGDPEQEDDIKREEGGHPDGQDSVADAGTGLCVRGVQVW